MAYGIYNAGMAYGRAPQIIISGALPDGPVTADLGVLLDSDTNLRAVNQAPQRFNSKQMANGGKLRAGVINQWKDLTWSMVSGSTTDTYWNQQLVNLQNLQVFSEGQLTGGQQNLRITYYNALTPLQKTSGVGVFTNFPGPSQSVGSDNVESLMSDYTFEFQATEDPIGDFNLAGLLNQLFGGLALLGV